MLIILLLIAYFLGSIPTGKIIAHRWYKTDIQKRGSGNIGFANVKRVVGWKPALAVLFFDIFKGFLPSILALQLLGLPAAFWVGIVAIAGHIFPIWLRFNGGKGVATGLGVLLALAPIAAAAGAIIYTALSIAHVRSSYASVAGIITASAVGTVLGPLQWWHYAILIVIAAWTLRHNLSGSVPNHDK